MFGITGAIRRGLMTAAVAAAVAAAVGGVSMARAGGSGDRTVTLTEVQTGGTFINVRHSKGPKAGDEFAFHAKLKNHEGTTVGSLDAICTLVLHARLQCEGTARLSGGTLALSAGIPAGDNVRTTHVAIVGGTGRYDRAHGQMTSTTTGSTTSRDVFDIDL